MNNAQNKSCRRVLLATVVPLALAGVIAGAAVYIALPTNYEAVAIVGVRWSQGLEVGHEFGRQAYQKILHETALKFHTVRPGFSDGALLEILSRRTSIRQLPKRSGHRFEPSFSDEEVLGAMVWQKRSELEPRPPLRTTTFRIAIRSEKAILATDMANAFVETLESSVFEANRDGLDSDVVQVMSKVESRRRVLESAELALKACQTLQSNGTVPGTNMVSARLKALEYERDAAVKGFHQALELADGMRIHSGQSPGAFWVEEAPRTPERALSPDLFALLALGLASGTLLGGVLAAGVCTVRKNRHDADDAEPGPVCNRR